MIWFEHIISQVFVLQAIFSNTGSTGCMPDTACESGLTPCSLNCISFNVAPVPPLVNVSNISGAADNDIVYFVSGFLTWSNSWFNLSSFFHEAVNDPVISNTLLNEATD